MIEFENDLDLFAYKLYTFTFNETTKRNCIEKFFTMLPDDLDFRIFFYTESISF